MQVHSKLQLSIMSQADVAMPSAAPCIVSIPMHAYIPDLDSEERALQARQMAPLSSAGYQQIPQSDQPPGAHGARSAASDRPRLDADNEETQQGNMNHSKLWKTHLQHAPAVPVGTARSRIWRTFLTSSSNNPFSTSIPKRKEEADQDDSKYERCKIVLFRNNLSAFGLTQDIVEDFEDGIPQLSRLMDSDKNFFVVRLFGPYAARILLQRELQLNTLIKRLCKLDREDAADITRQYRLCTTTFSEQGDPAQTELLREIEVKLGEYCKYRCWLAVKLDTYLLDDFLLKYMEVKALGKPTKRDQRSIQRWISDHAPLVDEESDFILYFDDLVTAKSHLNSTAPSNTIEDTIESYMANNPNSHLTVQW